jgi:hypothetical protein
MSEFLYIYRGPQRPTDPQEAQQVMQKWMTWLESLAKQGKIKDRGQPLEPAGKVVNGKQKAITVGPYAEAKELVLESLYRGSSVGPERLCGLHP